MKYFRYCIEKDLNIVPNRHKYNHKIGFRLNSKNPLHTYYPKSFINEDNDYGFIRSLPL